MDTRENDKAVDLTISIVNHSNRELLEQCLHSIFENTVRTSIEVFVVDNASSDGSTQLIKEEFPQVNLLINKVVLGFSANHNQVLRKAAGRYSLVLNEDTIVLPEALDKMVELMDTHPQAGAVGCKILNQHGEVQNSCFDFYNLRSVFLDYCLFPGGLIKNRFLGVNEPQHLAHGEKVDWLLGACILLRGDALKEVGLLDDSFFMYSEEVDWCYRAKQQGWEVLFTPNAQIIHYGGQATRKQEQPVLPQLYLSRYQFFQKHYGQYSSYLLKTLISMATAWNSLFLFLRFLLRRIKRKELIKEIGIYWNISKLLKP